LSKHWGVPQITDWKKQLIAGSEQIFNGFKADTSRTTDDALRDELYKQIGQLTVENEWLKKKSEQIFGKGKQNGTNR
jgi:transposase